MELKELRNKIDFIDFEILRLLNSRMEIVLRLKKIKKKITEPQREKKVLENVVMNSHGLVQPEFSRRLFAEIIKECKKLQEKDSKIIGFQGEHGAYGEVAAGEFKAHLVYIPFMEFNEIFEEVERGTLDYGIVPVENSLGGNINQIHDLLIETKLKVAGEVKLRIRHCLLILPDTDHRDIRVVFSHPQALTQCRKFLARNKLEGRSFYDTAGAAKMLVDQRPKAAAAIASELCAQLYNLEIVKEGIEDNESNITRFLILAQEENQDKGNKCSLLFSTPHKAGTLFKVLKIFAEANINLTRIESVPMIDESIGYAFFLDFLGSNKDQKVIGALEEVKKVTTMFKFLGCYQEGSVQ